MSLSNMYKQFMNGFTYIIPLAVVGGVFLNLYQTYDVEIFFQIGTSSLFLVYPVLSAFIAYAISDRPGFIIGLLGGLLITLGQSGFIGAVIIGFVSGYIITLFSYIFKRFFKSSRGLLPVFIYPVFGALIIGFVYLGINIIIPPINDMIRTLYVQLSLIPLLILVIILSIMMVYDLGGPINKIAYVIGVSSILSGIPNVMMAAIMIAGMIPPLSLALATTLFKHKFSNEDRQRGLSNYFMGLSFMSEGAITFQKKDKKFMYIFILGATISAILTVIFNVESSIAHGGILTIFFIESWFYFLAILIGTSFIMALLLGISLPRLKKEDIV